MLISVGRMYSLWLISASGEIPDTVVCKAAASINMKRAPCLLKMPIPDLSRD